MMFTHWLSSACGHSRSARTKERNYPTNDSTNSGTEIDLCLSKDNRFITWFLQNLQDDKSVIYLFVDSTRDTLDKNIELLIGLSCVSRWLDAIPLDGPVLNEKVTRGASASIEKPSIDPNVSKPIRNYRWLMFECRSIVFVSCQCPKKRSCHKEARWSSISIRGNRFHKDNLFFAFIQQQLKLLF